MSPTEKHKLWELSCSHSLCLLMLACQLLVIHLLNDVFDGCGQHHCCGDIYPEKSGIYEPEQDRAYQYQYDIVEYLTDDHTFVECYVTIDLRHKKNRKTTLNMI